MSRLWLPLALLLLCASGACSNNRGSAVSFAFNRPEHLDFACFAPYTALGEDVALRGRYASLPLSCCSLYDSTQQGDLPDLNSHPECAAVDGHAVSGARLHALVTQSTRGEVAAVDLVANRVLDSDRQVPGFTYIDSGGLPSALISPPFQLRAGGRRDLGSAWVYVASAEENQLRAIPSCRFRSGSACGPDLEPENSAAALSGAQAYEQRQRVALPAAPEDMILGPDESLWVTMPDRGQIARVRLPETPFVGNTPRPVDAFAVDGSGAMRSVAVPEWFGVPAPGALSPLVPVREEEYVATCGLGHVYAPARLELPLAPTDAPTDRAQPTRMLFDAETNLLLVADREAPHLTAFRLGDDGSLSALGFLPTGAAVREFVLTPFVPALAPDDLLAPSAAPEQPAPTDKRYLYAIDDRGLVMVFDFALDAEGTLPRLTPLLAPSPSTTSGLRYADRLDLPVPSATLAVIDTRAQSPYVCGEQSLDELRRLRNGFPPREMRTEAQERELARVLARLAVREDAASDQLRGVFVAVASTAGVISIIDVHDLDLACRAQRNCCANASDGKRDLNDVPTGCTTAGLITPRSSDSGDGLAVRRHAVRRASAGPQSLDSVSSGQLVPLMCPATPVQAAVPLAGGLVCAPTDPWSTRGEVWRVTHEGTLPSSQMPGARLEPSAEPGLLTMVAPAEVDLCAFGVEQGDLLAVIGEAPEQLRESCPAPSEDATPTFVIEEARRDRLTVRPRPVGTETPEALSARVTGCYPDFLPAELRAGGFVVTGSNNTFLHRVVADEQGRCVLDEDLDPLLDSRMREDPSTPGQLVFSNPYVTFALAAPPSGALPESREATFAVGRASSPLQLTTVLGNDSVTDALPVALRYLPDVGYLFLLDSASQGLRRYGMRPFRREDTIFR